MRAGMRADQKVASKVGYLVALTAESMAVTKVVPKVGK